MSEAIRHRHSLLFERNSVEELQPCSTDWRSTASRAATGMAGATDDPRPFHDRNDGTTTSRRRETMLRRVA
jgi:hypothetical protein